MLRGKQDVSHGDTLGRVWVGPSCRQPSVQELHAPDRHGHPSVSCVPGFQGWCVKMLAEPSPHFPSVKGRLTHTVTC